MIIKIHISSGEANKDKFKQYRIDHKENNTLYKKTLFYCKQRTDCRKSKGLLFKKP